MEDGVDVVRLERPAKGLAIGQRRIDERAAIAEAFGLEAGLREVRAIQGYDGLSVVE
jgi:hypothetical protein